jgi:hypothetical protein
MFCKNKNKFTHLLNRMSLLEASDSFRGPQRNIEHFLKKKNCIFFLYIYLFVHKFIIRLSLGPDPDLEKCLDQDPDSVNPDLQHWKQVRIQRETKIPNLQNLLLQRFLGLHINSLEQRLGPAAAAVAAAAVVGDIANILQLFHLHGRIAPQFCVKN